MPDIARFTVASGICCFIAFLYLGSSTGTYSMHVRLPMTRLPNAFYLAIFLSGGLLLTGCASETQGEAQRQQQTSQQEASQVLPAVTVYKSPTCGCCAKWVDHLEEHGFTVETHDVRQVAVKKDSLGVPRHLRSCHTAVVDGYVVEGHVPADVIKRMLTEDPAVAGLAVPGMPVGSPGMEVEGRPAESYLVAAFRPDTTFVYARR